MPGPFDTSPFERNVQIAPSQGVQPIYAPTPEARFPEMKVRDEISPLLSQIREVFGPQKKKAADPNNSLAELNAQLAELRRLSASRNSDPKMLAQNADPRFGNADLLDDSAGDYVARNASFESGNDPRAVNKGSGASGLFQFMPATWRGIMQERPDLGLTEEGIFDVEQQKKAMNHYTGTSARILSGMLGRKPTGGELYLLHLLGHGGGPQVLSNLDAPITSTIGDAAYRSNPFLHKYQTGRDLIAGLNNKFGG